MKFITKHPKVVIILVSLITLMAGWGASKIVLDNDVRIFFPEENQSYRNIKALDKTFGSQILMDICISTEKDTILTKRNLEIIQTLVTRLENTARVQSVTALTNSDYPDGSSEGMSVSPLVDDDFTGTPQELADLKGKLLDWHDMFSRTLYSDDFKATQILVRIDDSTSSDDMSLLYQEIMTMLEPYNTYPLKIVVAGDPIITEKGKEFMYADLAILIPIIVVVLFIALLLSFKRLSATILPLITVLISTVWTVGTMGAMGFSFTIISSCLPVLIIAVGSAYGIHIINHYFHRKKLNPEKGKSATISNLQGATKEVMVPIILAGFTTVVGFLSIVTSPIVPLKTFGFFAAVGTVYALVLSVTFIPALLFLAENRRSRKETESSEFKEDGRDSLILQGIVTLSEKYTNQTMVVVGILLVFSLWGVFNLNVENSLIEYFPYEAQIRKDSRFISENFAGTNTFNIVFEAPEGKNLSDPEALKGMDDLKSHLLQKYPDEIGKITSFSDFIKRMNQVMNFPVDQVIQDQRESEPEIAFEGTNSFFEEEMASTDSFFEDEITTNLTTAPMTTPEFRDLSQKVDYRDFILLLQESQRAAQQGKMDVAQLIEEVKKLTNYRGAAYNEVPYDPAKYPVSTREELQNLISQYLLLYSGSLDEFANDPLKPTQTRMLVQLREHGTSLTKEIIQEINLYAQGNINPQWKITNAGIAELELALTNMITGSQITSLLFALVAVFLILAINYRSIAAGLIGIVPLAFSILTNFGLMAFLDINLDMVTALIASIAIGIGVDYTVHFLSRYKVEREQSDDLAEVTRKTIFSTGKGILINAMSVGFGFSVLMFSRFMVLRYIGLLTAIIMLTSSLAALTILPFILNKLKPRFVMEPNTSIGERNE